MAKKTPDYIVKSVSHITSKKYGTPAARVVWVNVDTLEEYVMWIDKHMDNYMTWMEVIDDLWGIYTNLKVKKNAKTLDKKPVLNADSEIVLVQKMDQDLTKKVLDLLSQTESTDMFHALFR